MTIDEIMARFNEAPIQKQVDSQRLKAKELRVIARQLENEAKVLDKLADGYTERLDIEGNKIADQLDKEYPDWRLVLLKHFKTP